MVANIKSVGRKKRTIVGLVVAITGVALALVILNYFPQPIWYRLFLFPVFWIAGLCFVQAAEST